jgi:hypothetical protein
LRGLFLWGASPLSCEVPDVHTQQPPVRRRLQQRIREERYDPEPRRDWVRAAITLSLIFAPLAISGVALYSAHGDFNKSKELLDKLLPAHWSDRVCTRLLLRLEVLQRLDAQPDPRATTARFWRAFQFPNQMGSGHKSPGAHQRARLPRRASCFEGGLMAAATSPTLFASADPAPTPTDVADDHSLLTLDRELDFLLERIEDEIEENGEASKEAMDRLQLFCQAMNVKVDRIGRYLAIMKTRTAHCKEEAARYAVRAKRAESKIARTESMVLYYLESRDLKQLETDDFTFRRQRNSQDSVIVRDAQAVPPELNRYELKMDGGFYLDVVRALPDEMASCLRASVKFAEPSNTAIKQHFASGKMVEGVEVKRLYHLRIA